MKYRPDVEGLRAVAVLLVVAAHADAPWMAGGFIGVDVFFVLSGYLITGLLVAEREAAGRIDFMRFYARRFRRLMPALVLMLAVSGLAAWALLPVFDQSDQAIAGAAAALWLSNLHFAFADFDYFSPGAEGNVFLHTWSLGVEEQFYLVWPALVAAALGGATVGRARLRALMWCVLAGSLAACLLVTPASPQQAFYLTPMRAWQFAAGALVFLYLGPGWPGDVTRSARIHARAASVAGVALLVAALVFIDGNRAYPGAWALLPTAGACLVLTAGTIAPAAALPRLLALAPMQALGRLSYAWYLWHWPVLVLGASVLPIGDGVVRLGLVLLSLLVAAASYRWVERPLRHNDAILRVPRRAVLGAVLAMGLLAGIGIQWQQQAASSPEAGRAAISLPALYAMGCDDWYSSDRLNPCTFGEDRGGGRMLVVGDSIGLHWFPALERIAEREGMQLVVLTKSACAIVDVPFVYARIGREYTECATWRGRALAYAEEIRPTVLVIGSSHTYAFTGEEWREGTGRVLANASDAADRVAILRATPLLPFDGPACAAPRGRLQALLESADRCRAPARDSMADGVAAHLAEAAKAHANVALVDMNDLVCPDGECRAEQDGLLVFRDMQHLNAAFAATLADALGERLRAIPAVSR